MSTPLISVVMIFLDAARYIDEAIQSVLEQSYTNLELVLVDDGSTDASAAIARAHAGADDRLRCISHPGHANLGMSASRAAGIAAARGELIAFLDADDRWDPDHLEQQFKMLDANPDADLVCAPAYLWESWRDRRRVDARNAMPFPHGTVVDPPAMLAAILRDGGYAVPICSMLVRRVLLDEVGGPVVSFRTMFEDQAFQAKLFLAGRVVLSSTTTAWYRQHDESACAVAATTGEYDPNRPNPAYRRYLRWLRAYLESAGAHDPELWQSLRDTEAEYASRKKLVKQRVRIIATAHAPRLLNAALAVRHRHAHRPPVGGVRFGHLRRVAPISREFGYDRGLPVDRHYIESFLDRRRGDIRGRVLEVGEDVYTRAFGGADVKRVDVLHVDPNDPVATIVADFTDAPHVPDDAFDCLIVCQTLHLIYDLGAAVRTMHRVLRPGGVLLLTVPGISQQSDDQWGETWHWSLTRRSARRLFDDVFGAANVEIASYGNVLAAVAMLHGLASAELTRDELDHYDPAYEMIVAVRAVKAGS